MLTRIKAAFALGIANVFRVIWFRLCVRLSLNPVRRLRAVVPKGPFFKSEVWFEEASSGYEYVMMGFGYIPLGTSLVPPNWHLNILTGNRCLDSELPWFSIPDFTTELGDIKGVWELSRFDWVLGFSREYREGDTTSLAKLEGWLEDWVRANPPYYGPNWKCGQEASIRTMHLAMTAIILEQVDEPEASLLHLIEVHLQRIAPTILYAIAQDNNHGTSEAAALFIGGSWLASHGSSKGEYWQNEGRKWLENRARRLIEPDGSFSQYSVNYHRVVLDTFSMVELWRRKLSLPELSKHWYGKAVAATNWLRAMLQSNGDVPNIGANDGARLLPLAATDYRDFRPAVEMAAALFRNERAVPEVGEWDVALKLLGVDAPLRQAPAVESQLFDCGGYATMRNSGCFVLFRYPRFRFRPGHADALHVDLWLNGENLLRDGGSFSYNTIEPLQSYFPGVRAHNTVQFDHREPMPRISRFLFGEWLKTSTLEPLKVTSEGQRVAAGYRDYLGARHTRRLSLSDSMLRIEDDVSGFRERAILRWRLQPGDWEVSGHSVALRGVKIEVSADVPLKRVELVEGWESRYYGLKTPLPVLEVEVARVGHLVTDITWNQS